MIDPKELLFTVDDENNPIQPEARDLVHSKGIWHRTSHIWIVNDDGAVLCQQRSLSKDSNPGLWEPFFGGHLPPNTSYEQGAVDELKEELGISINKSDLALFSIYKADDGNEFQGVFIFHWKGDVELLQIETEEIEQVKLVERSYLDQLLVIDKHPEWSITGYTADILSFLQTIY